jgi:ATP-dependent exoDNAse (exonuclease V) alpha subunit
VVERITYHSEESGYTVARLKAPRTSEIVTVVGFAEKTGVQLSEQQRQAVKMAASHRVLILTGGPGTGKSFTCRTIVALWKAMGKAIALASPTGRAAQHGVAAIRDMMVHLIPKLGFDPTQAVQVLCPMTRGEVGTRHLNQVLQEVINPPSPDKAEL